MTTSFRLPSLSGLQRLRFPARLRFRLLRLLRPLRPPRLPWPVLTAAEKTALLAVTLVLSGGGALRVWERSGVSIGPVDDWETLRALVIRSREDLNADGNTEGGGYACLDEAPVMRAGGTGGGGASGRTTRPAAVPAAVFADARESGTSAKTKAAGTQGGADQGTRAQPLDLNDAGERALLALPGVGPATAKAIVAHRAARGRFHSIDDLLQVKGIGPKKLEALRPHVKVAEVTEVMKVVSPGDPAGAAGATDTAGAVTPGAGNVPPAPVVPSAPP